MGIKPLKNRYVLLKEGNIFNREQLEYIVQQLNQSYEIKNIDANLYQQIRSSSYHPFRDLYSQFESDEDYLKHG